jgi:CubicO group peptidase (beta-lactamase class C family)
MIRLAALMIVGAGAASAQTTRIGRPAATATRVREAARIDSVASRLFGLDASPGMAIVVVRDTQVIYLKGFGHADVEANRPFTPQTVFYIASTTKSFTGLAASILDRAGTFTLDAPLSQYLPELRLGAPLRAEAITIRSLLSHTHGISDDGPVPLRLAYTGEYEGNAHLIRLLAYHGPARTGRAYQYGNVGYNVAALAMDAVTRESWKETLRRLVFEPLRMENTSAFVSRFPAERLAMPYRTTPTGFVRVPYAKADANMQSAGGLVTTAADMGRWLEMHIGNGRVDGKQILNAAAVAETHKAQATFAQNARGMRMIGYGFGWQIGILGEDTILVHGGGFPGFSTHMSFMPQHRIGIAVMANSVQLGLVDLVAQNIYGALTGKGTITDDSLRALRTQLGHVRANIAADLARRSARSQTLRSPLHAYAGTYESPAFGRLVLSVVNGKLEARAGTAWSAVEVYDAAKNQLRVELFGAGEVATVTMRRGTGDAIDLGGMKFRRVK